MEFVIKINTIELVKKFCSLASQLSCDVLIKSGRYIIDGKSIMGIFSLDLSQILLMEIVDKDNSDDEVNEFVNKLKELRIIVEEVN